MGTSLLEVPAFQALVKQGWTDSLRELHPDERIYSFWHYWRNSFQRNAGLRLVPDEVAATTGLRFMFNNIGTIFAVSIVTTILNRSSTPGLTQAHLIWVMAAIVVGIMVPLVRGIPEHKGAW